MRLAILFSGQGSQQPEHLQRLKVEADAELAAALAEAIPEVWSGNSDDPAPLVRNDVAQPLIFGYQMMLWRQLQLPRPICVAGYSLGEMAACCAAGGFPAAAGNDLHLAIVNGPNHMVLGGRRSALAAAATEALMLGAMRTVTLPVSTPSHTPLLAKASNTFRAVLAHWDQPGRLAFPVLSAIDGRAAYTRSAALDALAGQISTPLDWARCLSNLIEMQPDRVLKVGPGNALSRMLEELAPGVPVRATGDFRSTEGIRNWLR